MKVHHPLNTTMGIQNPPMRSSAMSREEHPSGTETELIHDDDTVQPLPIPEIDDGTNNIVRCPAGLEEIHDGTVATEPFDESAAVSKKIRGGFNSNQDASSLAITDNENDGPISPFPIEGEII